MAWDNGLNSVCVIELFWHFLICVEGLEDWRREEYLEDLDF